MEIEKAIHMRRSVRKYTQEPINDEQLQLLLEAAQAAPLAMGDDKTTHITVVTDKALMEEIRGACMTTSRKTGLPLDALHGAPMIIFLSATDISSDHIEYSNVACVIENIMLQATALGLGSTYIWGCLRGFLEHKETVAKLGLPEGYEILSAVVVGHPVKPLEVRDKVERIGVNRI
jgi:nitroreductase